MYVTPDHASLPYASTEKVFSIVIDTHEAFLAFQNHFVQVYGPALTKNLSEYENDLLDLYSQIYTIAASFMRSDFSSYIDAVISNIDLTYSVFSDVLHSDVFMSNRYYDLAKYCASYFYFKLRSYRFLSDGYVYVIEQITPYFVRLTLYTL